MNQAGKYMRAQPDLFDLEAGKVRHLGRGIINGRNANERAIAEVLQGLGSTGGTAQEIADLLDWDKKKVGPRLGEMALKGTARRTEAWRNGKVYVYVDED